MDPSEQMNLASSVFSKSPKFIKSGLSSFNETGKPNSVFSPYTREESLIGIGGGILNGNWLASSHGFERVRKTKAYSNHIKKYEHETRKVFERRKLFRLKIFH